MQNLRKSIVLLAIATVVSASMTSCASQQRYGCPGKDRPSFRGGYGMTTPANPVLHLDSKTNQNLYNPSSMS